MALMNIKTASTNTPLLGTIEHRGEKIAVTTETSSGRAWLHKYLHPPTSTVSGYCGFPDRNNMPTACIEQKGSQEQFMSDGVVPEKDAPYAPAIKYLELITHGMARPSYGFAFGKSGSTAPFLDPNQTKTGFPSANVFYNPTNLQRDAMNVRQTYGSMTIYQDETAFSNRGTITVANFRPDIITVNGTNADMRRYVSDRYKIPLDKLRVVNASATSRVGDDFVVYSKREVEPEAVATKNFLIVIDHLPTSESEVMSLSRKAYSGMLRDGAFIINRMSQPTNNYDNAVMSTVNLLEVKTGLITTLGPSADGNWISSNHALTFVFYNNLQEGGTAFNPIGNHVVRKWFTGFEMQPDVGSSLACMAQECAMEDEMALKLANNVFHSYGDADVAATNGLATILTAALSAAPAAIDWIKGLFGKPAAPPPEKPSLNEAKILGLISAMKSTMVRQNAIRPVKQQKTKQQPKKPKAKLLAIEAAPTTAAINNPIRRSKTPVPIAKSKTTK